ncbi:MAG: MFS transporter, partial [Gammaproteobacteria bacterium]
SMKAAPRVAGSGNVFALLENRMVTLGMLAVGTFFMGQFVLFTYVRPFLETVTQVDVSTLSMILLTLGVAGFVGTTLISGFLKWGMYGTLVTIPLLMAAIALALIGFGASVAVALVLLGLWGLVATAAPVGWWSWLARSVPKNAEAGGGLMVAVIQLCIALGSTLGGVLFDGSGYRATFVASAVLLVGAATLAFLTSRAQASPAA